MSLARFRIRTLMIAVAVAAVALWAGLLALRDDTLIVLTVFMALPVGYLATCAFLLIRDRSL